jgi:hypothetical protein
MKPTQLIKLIELPDKQLTGPNMQQQNLWFANE